MRRPPRLLVAVCALAALAAAGSATADVLVTRDGQRVKTRGPWEVKGRVVVFTTADGQLASLRVADVDLEASRRVSAAAPGEEAKAPAAGGEESKAPADAGEAEPPRRSSGRRITNADIGPGQGPPPPAEAAGDEAEGEGEEAGEAAAAPVRRELAVLGIERVTAPNGHAMLRGTVRNTAAEPALGVRLTIHLHDVDGVLAGTAQATLGSRALQPGAETTFEADFPDVYAYESMRLEPRATFLETTAGDDGSGDEAGAETNPPGTS